MSWASGTGPRNGCGVRASAVGTISPWQTGRRESACSWHGESRTRSEPARRLNRAAIVTFPAPLWLGVVTAGAWALFGPTGALAALLGTLPLALYTRYFLERRASAVEDARTFFVLTRRASLKARLLAEGERIAGEVDALAAELRPRVAG